MENKNVINEDIKKLGGLISGITFAMVTTVEDDGKLRSRPMATQQIPFDGDLWFLTGKRNHMSQEVEHMHNVNISYANPAEKRYISISGKAQLVQDKEKAATLWNPLYQEWFPNGANDPNLILIKVIVEQAEYWDGASNKMVELTGFTK